MIISNKDIQKIMRCSQPTASRKLKMVKDVLGRKQNQYVTINEFCEYYGIQTQDIKYPRQLSLF